MMSQDNGIHPTNNPLPSQVAVDYADYQTTIGDPPICGRCGLPMFSGDKSMDDVNICPSCYKAGNVTLEPGWKTKPSDLELSIRKEVMDELEDIIQKHEELALNKTGLLHIKDRLNLLWGSND